MTLPPYYTFYSHKVILVTGGAGAIGRNLVQALLKIDIEKIIVFDNLSSSAEWNIPKHHKVIFLKGDIRKTDDLLCAFQFKPEIVFHLAAFFANQRSVDFPLECEEVNGNGILKILELCVTTGNVERFIYTNSEGGAYGSDSVSPYSENNISYNLSTPYYITKMSGEAYCNYYYSQYGLPVSILRLFNSYGPGEIPGPYRNVIPNFIYWALNKISLPLTGPETISRDFVYVADTVEAILRAGFFIEAIATPINVSTSKKQSIYEIAHTINRIIGNNSGVHVLRSRKWDTRISILGDNTRCKQILKFTPETDFETGLLNTIKWFIENQEKINETASFFPGKTSATEGKLIIH